jgi:glutamyl-Q tRNA(Asp) synthetase
MNITTRFAPSPTGYLHLGHAYAAWFAHQQAGSGTFLLRLEDIDPTRCKDEFATAICEDLAWLGLPWSGAVLRQSQNMAAYHAALTILQDRGLLYPCFCTRRDIIQEAAASGHAPHGPEGLLYSGLCRSLAATERQDRIASGAAFCWRLDMTATLQQTGTLQWHDAAQGEINTHPQDFGDVVLARKETPTSYHLAVVVDDAAQGVTLVTRSEDLFRATDVHCVLQKLLGLPTPAYHHHALLTDEKGQRYAKRHQSVTLRALRQQGVEPATILAPFQKLAGFSIGDGV